MTACQIRRTSSSDPDCSTSVSADSRWHSPVLFAVNPRRPSPGGRYDVTCNSEHGGVPGNPQDERRTTLGSLEEGMTSPVTLNNLEFLVALGMGAGPPRGHCVPAFPGPPATVTANIPLESGFSRECGSRAVWERPSRGKDMRKPSANNRDTVLIDDSLIPCNDYMSIQVSK